MPENVESAWSLLKCEWFFILLSWLARLPWACVQRVRSPRRRCATWRNWWWGRKCKCTCTGPKCRRFRRWRKNCRKLPRRIWRRLRRCRWPKWEPDQKSLWVRVIKASRLDGFKMAVKEKMHFAARLMYVVSYKLFTAIAIYLIIVSSVKILKTPIIYKYAGKVPVENIVFPGIDVCPSHLFPAQLLRDSQMLFEKANRTGSATDLFGEKWSLTQTAKLYYYIFKRCEATRSHSRFFDLAFEDSLNLGILLEDHNNFTLKDDLEDQDFQKILQLVKKYGGTVDCSKMLAACRWGPDKNWNCSEIFEAVETETGSCCRFKRIDKQVVRKQSTENNSEAEIEKWNIDEHKFVEDVAHLDKRVYESERFQKVAGVDHGLTFVLIMEIDDMACPMNAGNAYMVFVHSALDAPQTFSNGILVEPGHEVHINVVADITLSDKAVISLPVDIRQCYFQEENYINSTRYTENNCHTLCRSLLFQKKCNCHKLGTTVNKKENICGPQHAACEKELEIEIEQKVYSQMCRTLKKPMNCYHGCTEVKYSTTVTSTSYSRTPTLVKKLKLMEGQATAIVRIGFGSDTADAQEMQQQYDFWEIVGIIGGILGLMIGVDFMTAIHLIYSWGIYFKGLWLKRKLANSVVVRSIVNVTSILDAVHSVSTQTPTDCRPHPLDFAKRKNFKRIVIRRKTAVAPTDPAIPLEPNVPDPIAELTPTNGTEMPAGPNQPTTMADIVMTNELLKKIFVIHKQRVEPVNLSDSVSPVALTDDIDIVPLTDHIDSTETMALVDRITTADAIAVINSLAPCN